MVARWETVGCNNPAREVFVSHFCTEGHGHGDVVVGGLQNFNGVAGVDVAFFDDSEVAAGEAALGEGF